MARRRECAAAFSADLRSTLPPAATELAPVATQVDSGCTGTLVRRPQIALLAGPRNAGPMPEEPLRLRPIEEADLVTLRRFDTDPPARGPYLPSASGSPQVRRRAGRRAAGLAVTSTNSPSSCPTGTLAGIVGWRTIKTAGPEGGCPEIGVLLFPEHRGKGYGTAAQRLLAGYRFATTLANWVQSITDVENSLSSGRWSAPGSAVRASCGA
jgi:ribosomal-protein-alanine N-acetyltransferase